MCFSKPKIPQAKLFGDVFQTVNFKTHCEFRTIFGMPFCRAPSINTCLIKLITAKLSYFSLNWFLKKKITVHFSSKGFLDDIPKWLEKLPDHLQKQSIPALGADRSKRLFSYLYFAPKNFSKKFHICSFKRFQSKVVKHD